jgi:hypothetical protein
MFHSFRFLAHFTRGNPLVENKTVVAFHATATWAHDLKFTNCERCILIEETPEHSRRTSVAAASDSRQLEKDDLVRGYSNKDTDPGDLENLQV